MGMQLNEAAMQHARGLIRDGEIDMDSDWSDAQPSTDSENSLLDEQDWAEYGKWYLALDRQANEETKDRHNFPYGDFQKVHRDGVIAAKQRAAQYDYSDIERAADELLEMIDERARANS